MFCYPFAEYFYSLSVLTENSYFVKQLEHEITLGRLSHIKNKSRR